MPGGSADEKRPGGVAIFSFSNRMFSDKAIKGWINR
ncbi:unnamed protein product, partial [Ectocarpus sp. 12 AP-2014]